MNPSLTKGETVTLAGTAGERLRDVRMGLAWDTIKRPGKSGTVKQIAVDLDASAIVLSAEREVLEIVYYGHVSTIDNSLRHTGDNLTGRGDGDDDDESIMVDLSKVAANVAHIVFVVSSYSGQNLSQVENATARVVDCSAGDHELARYQLSGLGSHTAIVMARLSRSGTGWTFTAIGTPGNARTADQLVPLALQSL
jgi:tellurium resistance protein TerZ